ncbi:hypothetical protein TNCV_2851101 [Trichonephila clavipes]|nr:hypothetical protein TNCV_2851101 [Trichonephila clavipes]
MSSNTCQLRVGEGESLTSVQKEKLNFPLESFQNIFEPGGEATTILEHHTSALTPYNNDRVKPLISLRKRCRPPKVPQTPGSSLEPEEEDVTNGLEDILIQQDNAGPVLPIGSWLTVTQRVFGCCMFTRSVSH